MKTVNFEFWFCRKAHPIHTEQNAHSSVSVNGGFHDTRWSTCFFVKSPRSRGSAKPLGELAPGRLQPRFRGSAAWVPPVFNSTLGGKLYKDEQDSFI